MIRTVTHKGKTFTIKEIKEEIIGLIIDDTSSEKISEAFGWPDEKFDKFLHTFIAFYNFSEAAEELDAELPKHTRISILAEFFKSASFKKLGIKIEKPNDYFMVGFIFLAGMVSREKRSEEGKLSGAMKIGAKELFELLKDLKERG